MGKGILHKLSLQSHLSSKREGKKVRNLKISQDSHMKLWLLSVTFSLLSLNRHAWPGCWSRAWLLSSKWSEPFPKALARPQKVFLFIRNAGDGWHTTRTLFFMPSLSLVSPVLLWSPSHLFTHSKDKLCEIIFWHMGMESEFSANFLIWFHLYHWRHFGCYCIWVYKFFMFYFALK